MKLRKVNSSTKYQVFKLYEDTVLKYFLKERIEKNITKSKTKYYLQSSSFQFISSLYPQNKHTDFNGIFSLAKGKTYLFDYENKAFKLSIHLDTISIDEVL